MKDKKRSFWILLIFFGFLTIAGLGVNKFNPEGMQQMGLSMGGMMKTHHASGLTPSELLKAKELDHGMGDMTGHHQIAPLMQSLAFLTSVIVFISVSLILGGVSVLIVLWN